MTPLNEGRELKRVLFFLSIPERMLRALAGIVGGALLQLLDVLIPGALKSTTIYRVLIGDGLRFAVERVAGMPPAIGSEGIAPLPRDYQARKLAGTAIESLGLLVVQFSPLWVFAIAGDAAAGSKVFLQRLEGHLKHEGVIAPEVEVDELTDLLDALQRASRTTATTIDAPPLSRAEIRALVKELREAYRQVFMGSANLAPRLDHMWSRMQLASREGGVSLLEVASYMSANSQRWFTRGRGAMRAFGRTGKELVGEQILEGYQRTLDELASGGLPAFLRVRISPYLLAARGQFDPQVGSWTEAVLWRIVRRVSQR
jgi:hypothetical protein